jgi:hypothetical protein
MPAPSEVNMRGTPDQDEPFSHSELFTMRIWLERTDLAHREVRLQVRHVLTGETRYFRDWPSLAAYVTGKLDSAAQDA